MWSELVYAAVGFAAGVVSTVVVKRIWPEEPESRADKRALLGLPDRDAQRPGSVGTARIYTADYRERDPESGMQM